MVMYKKYITSILALSLIAPYTLQAVSPQKQNLGITPFLAAGAGYLGHRAYQSWNHYNHRNTPKKRLFEPKNPADAPLVMLIAHGLGGNERTANYYRKHAGLPADSITIRGFDFPGAGARKNEPISLAQHGNIQCLLEEYKKSVNNGERSIWKGVSNGGTSQLVTAGMYELENVEAFIFESPYDSIENAIRATMKEAHTYKIKRAIKAILRKTSTDEGSTLSNVLPTCASYLHWVPGLANLLTVYVSYLYRGYSPYGVRPIDVVHKINKNKPVLFICSATELPTAAAGVRALYQKLKDAGHLKVHLLVVPDGDHANLLQGPYAQQYRATEHAFLRHYGLPHDPELARQSIHPDFKKQPINKKKQQKKKKLLIPLQQQPQTV